MGLYVTLFLFMFISFISVLCLFVLWQIYFLNSDPGLPSKIYIIEIKRHNLKETYQKLEQHLKEFLSG